jgi:hypothetical protein
MAPKSRGGGGGLSRRAAVALIGGGGLLGLSSTGAFSQVDGDRPFSVSTASDENALLGINNIPKQIDIPAGSSRELFTLTNQLPNRNLYLTVSSESNWLNITSPNENTRLKPSRSVDVDGRVTQQTNSESAGGTADVQITATGKSEPDSEGNMTIDVVRSLSINVSTEGGASRFIIGVTDGGKLELYKAVRTGEDTVRKILPKRGNAKTGGNLKAIGTIGSDFDEDSNPEVAAIKNKNKIIFADEDGVLNQESINVSGKRADTQKTTLATGSWKGYNVFYSHGTSKIIGVSRNGNSWGTPTEIAAPGNGVNAVLPPADIDNDGADELPFADSSQHVRYVDETDDIVKITNGGVGSSNNVGVGPVATIDGRTLMPTVTGSNNIKFLGPSAGSSSGKVSKIAVFNSGVDAAKSRLTVADIDRDGELEVVYLTNSKSKLKYIDDINIGTGQYTIHEVVYDDEALYKDRKRGVV